MKMRGDQVFVQVSFDFDYISEDGKHVHMKENEILLLINKTNHDWWQVIRRGDRRPFYAPARYVNELRPEEIELSTNTAEVASTHRILHGLGGMGHHRQPIHYPHRPQHHRSSGRVGSPIDPGMPHPLLMQVMPTHLGSPHHPATQHPQLFSTFQANRVPPLSSKRSSYSPKDYTTASSSGGVSNSVDHLFFYDGHSTTSSTGSRRSIASNSHHLRSYPHQGPPNAGTSGRAAVHGSLYENPLDKKQRSPTSTSHINSGPSKVISSSRFKERYRSNSLDSILVADLNNKVFSAPSEKESEILGDDTDSTSTEKLFPSPPTQHLSNDLPQFSNVRHSTTIFHLHPPQHHLIPKHYPGNDNSVAGTGSVISGSGGGDTSAGYVDKNTNIQKRPTFDSLDKRKSWSVETTTNTSGLSRQISEQPSHEASISPASLLNMGSGNSNSNISVPTSTTNLSSISTSKNSPKSSKENTNNGRFSSKTRKKSNNAKDTTMNPKKQQITHVDKHTKQSKKFPVLSNVRTPIKTTDNKNEVLLENTSKDIKDNSNSSNFTITRAKQATADCATSQLLDEQQCNSNAFIENTQKPVISPTMSLSPYQNTQGIGLDSYGSAAVNLNNFNKSTSNLNSVCSSDINNVVGSSYNSSEGNTVDYRKKKPVPLPRSKIPLPSQQQLELEKAQSSKPKPVQRTSVASRLFWKRSKTDLGVDAVAAYKNNKQNRKEANVSSTIKYPAPKVPTFNRPLPQCSDLPVVIDVPNVKRRSSTITNDRKARDARQRLHLASGNLIRPENSQQKSSNLSCRTESETPVKPKPEIKEKPTFSTFKQQNNTSVNNSAKQDNKSDKPPSTFTSARKSSTLSKKLAHGSQGKTKDSNSSLPGDHKQRDFMKSSKKSVLDEVQTNTLSLNNVHSASNGEIEDNKILQNYRDTSIKNTNNILDNSAVQNATTSSRHDSISTTEYENIINDTSHATDFKDAERLKKKQQKSAPLMISTEPLISPFNINDNNSFEENDNKYVNSDHQQERMSESADKSCSTSFDSMEDSSVVHGSRALINSSTSSVLSVALSNAKNERNLTSTQIETTGSDLGICQKDSFEKTDDNRIKISNEFAHTLQNTAMADNKKSAIDITEGNISTKQDTEEFQEESTKHDIFTTPEPILNIPLSMSDSSLQLKSPVSTTSRSPPSPTSFGATPTRQVMVDWDEFLDNQSGRKFYYNTITKEKSWKPPRKIKGSMGEGGSANASPDLHEDTFDGYDIGADAHRVKKRFSFDNEDNDQFNNDDFSLDKSIENEDIIPHGYEHKTDPESGKNFYMNMFTGVRWFSAIDQQNGKMYFYEENGNESCWTLPNVSQSIQDPPQTPEHATSSMPSFLSSLKKRSPHDHDIELDDETHIVGIQMRKRTATTGAIQSNGKEKVMGKLLMTKTGALQERRTKSIQNPLPVSTPDIRIGSVSIVVNKQGPLHKTKWVENGKKHRKHWTNSHAVLTDTFLLFFKDVKTFQSMSQKAALHGSHSKPDICVDLKGANVDWSPQHSKRNNVFEVATLLGTTILLQDDYVHVAGEWFQEINKVIDTINQKTMPPTPNLAAMNINGDKLVSEDNEKENLEFAKDSELGQGIPSGHSTLQLPACKKEREKNKSVNRTKSLKMKLFVGSNSELDTSGEQQYNKNIGDVVGQASQPSTPNSGAKDLGSSQNIHIQQNRNNIREMLRKLFLRRPTIEDLFGRGIIKNEPVFGSTLRELQATDLSDVPLFVKKCVSQIESGDLLKTDGVYRQSGNLSTIQKIRLQVDQGNLNCLEAADDVHVLTGALKLFFRELREPLIPWEIVDKLLLAANSQSRKQKVKQMKSLVQSMPTPHRTTLGFLLRHLVKVTEFKDRNRMQFSNLAIVFGPTLMWPPTHLVSHNLALDMMQQNIIVEALLNNVQQLFN